MTLLAVESLSLAIIETAFESFLPTGLDSDLMGIMECFREVLRTLRS